METIYETVIVVSPDLTDDAAKEHADKIRNTLGDWGAAIESVDFWGRRRLEYEIQRKREGIYYVILFKIDKKENPVAKLERMLGLDEEVLRQLTVRRDDLVKARAARRRADREERAKKKEARQAAIAARQAQQAEELMSQQAEEEAPAQAPEGDAPEAEAPVAEAAPTEEAEASTTEESNEPAKA